MYPWEIARKKHISIIPRPPSLLRYCLVATISLDVGILGYMVITGHKRSLGQGNIFTSVCHSFCPKGRGLHPRGSASRGVSASRGSLHPGGLHPGGVCIQEWSVFRGVSASGGGVCSQGGGQTPPHRILSTRGRYASYWNAFLYLVYSLTFKICCHQYHPLIGAFSNSPV